MARTPESIYLLREKILRSERLATLCRSCARVIDMPWLGNRIFGEVPCEACGKTESGRATYGRV